MLAQFFSKTQGLFSKRTNGPKKASESREACNKWQPEPLLSSILKSRYLTPVLSNYWSCGFLFLNHYRHQTLVQEEGESLTATGTIEAKSVLASFKVAGRIDSLTVEEGSYVEKGAGTGQTGYPGELPPG